MASITFTSTGGIIATGSIAASEVYNAVWNDYADAVVVNEDAEIEPGFAYAYKDGKYVKTNRYMDSKFIGLDSDTYSHLIGYTSNKKLLRIPVGGFALAYVDKEYPAGTPLTVTKDGKLTKIRKLDKILRPEMVVATFWKAPDTDEFGIEKRKVKTKDRYWIKIK